MARNVEIKAEVEDMAAVRKQVALRSSIRKTLSFPARPAASSFVAFRNERVSSFLINVRTTLSRRSPDMLEHPPMSPTP
jgi:hypothetical protein